MSSTEFQALKALQSTIEVACEVGEPAVLLFNPPEAMRMKDWPALDIELIEDGSVWRVKVEKQ